MPYPLLILLGLGILTVGAEVLIRGASRNARWVGLSPLVVGLTVVALGTSMPEVAVSVKAALGGQSDIAVGNVIGSNIFNVLFILGLSASIAPLTVSNQLIRLDVPVMIGVSGLAWVLALKGVIGRVEGAFLLLGCMVYTAILVQVGRKKNKSSSHSPMPREDKPKISSIAVCASLLFVVIGLGFLVLGGNWFVEGSVVLARRLGVRSLARTLNA